MMGEFNDSPKSVTEKGLKGVGSSTNANGNGMEWMEMELIL